MSNEIFIYNRKKHKKEKPGQKPINKQDRTGGAWVSLKDNYWSTRTKKGAGLIVISPEKL